MDWEGARDCPNSLINPERNQPGQATTEEVLYLVEYNVDSGHVQSPSNNASKLFPALICCLTSSMVHFLKT